jgi:hypothetical protein
MDIPDKFLKISILFNNYGFAAILEPMPMPAVTPVLSAGITQYPQLAVATIQILLYRGWRPIRFFLFQ